MVATRSTTRKAAGKEPAQSEGDRTESELFLYPCLDRFGNRKESCSHVHRYSGRRSCPHYGYTKWQGYHLLVPAIDRRLPITLISHANSPAPCFYDILAEPSTDWIWATLARPPSGYRAVIRNRIDASHGLQKLSALEALPAELLNIVVSYLGVFPDNDVVSLCLSSPIFWPWLVQEVHRVFTSRSGALAGKRLAFAGTQIKSLPNFWETGTHRSKGIGDAYAEWETCKSLFMTHTRVFEIIRQTRGWSHITERTESDVKMTNKEIIVNDLDFTVHFPQDRTWLLRNLTKRKYVTSTALKGTGLNFHHVLLCRIARMQGAFFGGWENKDKCGAWVGDRFDLVTDDAHFAELAAQAVGEEEEPWEDVSDEVIAFTAERVTEALDAKEADKSLLEHNTQLAKRSRRW